MAQNRNFLKEGVTVSAAKHDKYFTFPLCVSLPYDSSALKYSDLTLHVRHMRKCASM